uniref:Uncharacterized protein n=1 Tax=Anguilla anguilla TaxID=7936 RepID=A0A0E9P9B8_ANGAN
MYFIPRGHLSTRMPLLYHRARRQVL